MPTRGRKIQETNDPAIQALRQSNRERCRKSRANKKMKTAEAEPAGACRDAAEHPYENIKETYYAEEAPSLPPKRAVPLSQQRLPQQRAASHVASESHGGHRVAQQEPDGHPPHPINQRFSSTQIVPESAMFASSIQPSEEQQQPPPDKGKAIRKRVHDPRGYESSSGDETPLLQRTPISHRPPSHLAASHRTIVEREFTGNMQLSTIMEASHRPTEHVVHAHRSGSSSITSTVANKNGNDADNINHNDTALRHDTPSSIGSFNPLAVLCRQPGVMEPVGNKLPYHRDSLPPTTSRTPPWLAGSPRRSATAAAITMPSTADMTPPSSTGSEPAHSSRAISIDSSGIPDRQPDPHSFQIISDDAHVATSPPTSADGQQQQRLEDQWASPAMVDTFNFYDGDDNGPSDLFVSSPTTAFAPPSRAMVGRANGNDHFHPVQTAFTRAGHGAAPPPVAPTTSQPNPASRHTSRHERDSASVFSDIFASNPDGDDGDDGGDGGDGGSDGDDDGGDSDDSEDGDDDSDDGDNNQSGDEHGDSDDSASHGTLPDHEPDDPDDDDDDEDAIQARHVAHAARKVYSQLVGGFHGCGLRQHDRQLRKHMHTNESSQQTREELPAEQTTPPPNQQQHTIQQHQQHQQRQQLPIDQARLGREDNHYDLLDATRLPDGFPRVLSSKEAAKQMLDASEISDGQWPSAQCLQDAFHGMQANARGKFVGPARRVCLHMEESADQPAFFRYDIDSFMGFPSSLGVVRKGFEVQLVPMNLQNITTDIHLKAEALYIPSDGNDRGVKFKQMPLKGIPHMYLGRIDGIYALQMHIFFPNLSNSSGTFVALTDEQQEEWVDTIILPALTDVLGEDDIQQIPTTWALASANSRAARSESMKIDASGVDKRRPLHYALDPLQLHELWQNMEHRANQPGSQHWSGAMLFFSAKGTKPKWKSNSSRPTLYQTIAHFREFFDEHLDSNYLPHKDQIFFDIGKATIARNAAREARRAAVAPPSAAAGSGGQVYLYRRCCLSTLLNWMYDGHPPKSRPGCTFFHETMLAQAGCLTSVPPVKSRLAKGGLAYFQLYNSSKMLADAQGVWPFANQALQCLSVDPKLFSAFRTMIGGNVRRQSDLQKAYLASKARACEAYTTPHELCYGLREEYRCSLQLVEQICELDRQCASYEANDSEATPDNELAAKAARIAHIPLEGRKPSYAWTIQTPRYCRFILNGLERYTGAFELILARLHGDVIPWEQSKLLEALLRCLPLVVHDSVRHDGALFWDKKTGYNEGHLRETLAVGLGFDVMAQQSNYYWMRPRIDWANFRFLPKYSDRMGFGEHPIRDQYFKAQPRMKALLVNTQKMEKIVAWMLKCQQGSDDLSQLTELAACVCLEQYLRDMMHAMQTTFKSNVTKREKKDALSGKVPFTYGEMQKLFTARGIHLVKGQVKISNVLDMVRLIWDDGDDYDDMRASWKNTAYRVLLGNAVKQLQQSNAMALATELQYQVVFLFLRHCRIIPHAGAKTLTPVAQGKVKTSAGSNPRSWFSIRSCSPVTTHTQRPDGSKHIRYPGRPTRPTSWFPGTHNDGRQLEPRYLKLLSYAPAFTRPSKNEPYPAPYPYSYTRPWSEWLDMAAQKGLNPSYGDDSDDSDAPVEEDGVQIIRDVEEEDEMEEEGGDSGDLDGVHNENAN